MTNSPAASPIDYEREYDNRGRVPEHPALIDGWYRDAAAARAKLNGRLDLRYADGPRCRLDLFEPAERRGPAVVFFHGGYWQSQDKSGFSHLAQGPLAHGLPVAIVGYDLCPDTTVGSIIAQAEAACHEVLGLTEGPLLVAGHSAGGHLAACLATTPQLPVQAAFCLSGLFDLTPLLSTTINTKLGLDAAQAQAWSPLFGPRPSCAVEAWVGEQESAEYHRQAQALAAAWSPSARSEVLAAANHFTIIAPLANPASRLVHRLVRLAG
ncbi:MAG: alpha/beta hydrolase [Geminicoccaceae bacterium]|nr:MAG: alpha/beta hydrolase [Geminicoccaceae bacterium]